MSKGFTLIELLIVIAIIAGLAGIALITFPSAQTTARDTRRKSDLKQYASALETYANRSNGLYPSFASDIVTSSSNNSLCTALGLGSACAFDPKDPTNQYHYVSNGTGGGSSSASQYVLYATLERPVSGSTWIWVVCSSGAAGRAAVGTSFAGGACPNNLQQ